MIALRESSLPPGWKETIDAKYGKPYYYNTALGISRPMDPPHGTGRRTERKGRERKIRFLLGGNQL